MKTQHLYIAWSGLLLWLLATLGAQAQQRVQVVTRTLEQQWNCPPGTAVRIQAEKATLRVQGWDKPQVQVTLRLSARHPDRAVAERDLAAARYRLEGGSTISLVNFFALPAGAAAIQSDLRAEYTVMMPAANPLTVANTYGQTFLTDLRGKQQLTQDFGRITLRDLAGTLSVTARYADLTATGLSADFICEASKSAVQLLELGGTAKVYNQFGSVRVQPAAGLRRLTVEGQRTEVTLSVLQPEQFAYDLSVAQGPLAVPAAYQSSQRQALGRATLAMPAKNRPLLRVATTYGPLRLQTQPLLAQP
ncbi:hypothetical protein [Hymenobacter actinosclerus]|uniref:Adhesin domain-containing protein n=1 Tax=Hymenobacter actinosclerus TaxID=82805 RepID=A0A1I0F5E1_9BACT|nr:hypothetical protein [Hymenobacter actinosclerus]SET52290.1 hypothetical protein SAMN04487998_2101 [Hymenobacter actinosclerus]